MTLSSYFVSAGGEPGPLADSVHSPGGMSSSSSAAFQHELAATRWKLQLSSVGIVNMNRLVLIHDHRTHVGVALHLFKTQTLGEQRRRWAMKTYWRALQTFPGSASRDTSLSTLTQITGCVQLQLILNYPITITYIVEVDRHIITEKAFW